MVPFDPKHPMAALDALYREVDRRMEGLYARHGRRLRCRPGCADCCVDGITVFEVEARRIRRHCREVFGADSAHPTGACALLDGRGLCRIYPHRPYVCRTQGPPLRWLETGADGVTVEMRDICPLNDPGPPIEGLPPEACWEVGPAEGVLAALQHAADGGKGRRIALRDLFAPAGSASPYEARESNPWLTIPLSDYEGHMASPGVAQHQALNRLFRDLLARCRPLSLAVPGASGGNGFEHIDPSLTRRVVAVDIQPDYLRRLSARFSDRIPGLETRCEDLATTRLEPAAFDLVHCALVLEYLEAAPLIREMARWLRPGGLLALVLQMPSDRCGRVSDSPFPSLRRLAPVMRLVDPAAAAETARGAGLEGDGAGTVALPGGKSFRLMRFRRPSASRRFRG
jgi:SAM-dependent methyltransferase